MDGCPVCGATGVIEWAPDCPVCRGTGSIECSKCKGKGNEGVRAKLGFRGRPCSNCKGSGKTQCPGVGCRDRRSTPCPSCKGTGEATAGSVPVPPARSGIRSEELRARLRVLNLDRGGAPPPVSDLALAGDDEGTAMLLRTDQDWQGPLCCAHFKVCRCCKICHCKRLCSPRWLILGAVYLVLIIVALVISQQRHDNPLTWIENYLVKRIWRNLICLTFTILKMYYDYLAQGGIGIRNGLYSGLVAWLFVMPFQRYTVSIMAIGGVFLAIALLVFGAIAFIMSLCCPSMRSTYQGALIAFSALLVAVLVSRFQPAVGTAFSDIIVFIGCSIFFEHGVLTVIPQDVTEWGDFVQEVPSSSEEFRMQEEYVQKLAQKHKRHYRHGVSIERMYRVYPKLASLAEGQDEDPLFLQSVDPGGINTFRLFHGTSYGAAEAIINDGYRKPVSPLHVKTGSMFGKGIYFADSPQKSMQYSQNLPGRGKLLLLNRVELGQPKFLKMAAPGEKGYDASKGSSWLVPTLGDVERPSDAYDSVVAVTKDQGGKVQVPEYIIYEPRQATVEYILEVDEVPL